MTRLSTLISSVLLLAPTASAVYTGFNYGAFWGEVGNAKKAADFYDGFDLARNLNTGTPFNSARLFTCKQQGTSDEPTEAFDAAVDTSTSLLLGFWTTPGKKGDPIKDIIEQELSALEKGFQKHGQALSDLIIGLSVGSEDVFRFEDSEESGVSAKDISSAIATVKEAMKTGIFAKFMHDKPIGHVDTAKHVVVDGADFYGMTAYPYWNKESAEQSKESFLGSLDNVKQRAGNTPVWIAEMGWPFDGPQQGAAVAGKDSLQKFWTDVGCEIIGKYNTFWFELVKDSTAEQPDWGILDAKTHQPRIDLNCPGLSPPNGSTTAGTFPIATRTALSTIPSSGVAPVVSSNPIGNSSAAYTSELNTSTVRVTTTIEVTVQPSGPASTLKRSSFGVFTNSLAPACSKITPAPKPSLISSELPWCVTVADIASNGQYLPVDGNPAGPDGSCTAPPTYTGLPYGRITGTAASPVSSLAAVPSTPSTVISVAPPASTPPTSMPPASSPAPVSSSRVPASVSASSLAAKPSGNPYCKRKASTLGGLATTSRPAKVSLVTRSSSTTLPDFTLVTDKPAAEKDKRSGGGSIKKWIWWW